MKREKGKRHISWNQQANDLLWWCEEFNVSPEKLLFMPNLVLYPLPEIVQHRLAIRLGRRERKGIR